MNNEIYNIALKTFTHILSAKQSTLKRIVKVNIKNNIVINHTPMEYKYNFILYYIQS